MGAVRKLGLVAAREPEPGFMDKGRGSQGLTGRLVCQFVSREFPQLVVDQGQECFRGPGSALFA